MYILTVVATLSSAVVFKLRAMQQTAMCEQNSFEHFYLKIYSIAHNFNIWLYIQK